MATVREPEVALADKEELISGSEAIAVACKLADVDVITAYPIRPYDTMMQFVAKQIANGEQDAEYIVAESEHSQFEIVKHASSVNARAFGGSSGTGWFTIGVSVAATQASAITFLSIPGQGFESTNAPYSGLAGSSRESSGGRME